MSAQPTWIDDAVGREANVVALWWEPGTAQYASPSAGDWVVWLGEFFNRSVGDVFRIGHETYYETFLPTVPVDASSDGSLVDMDGTPVAAHFVLVTCRTRIAGTTVARGPDGQWNLVRTGGLIRVRHAGDCDAPASGRGHKSRGVR